jgi:hypothetical protein
MLLCMITPTPYADGPASHVLLRYLLTVFLRGELYVDVTYCFTITSNSDFRKDEFFGHMSGDNRDGSPGVEARLLRIKRALRRGVCV